MLDCRLAREGKNKTPLLWLPHCMWEPQFFKTSPSMGRSNRNLRPKAINL